MNEMNIIEINLVNMLQEVLDSKAIASDIKYYVVETIDERGALTPIKGAMCTVNSNESGTQGTYIYDGTTWVFKF